MSKAINIRRYSSEIVVHLSENTEKLLKDIREELDEHLDALNQNTVEISAANEYVSELDLKLQKLAERVDALQALLLAQTPAKKKVRLTPKEEGVLRILLEQQEPLTSLQLGRLCGLTPDLMAQTLYCLKQKEVPILAQNLQDQTYYILEAQYKKNGYNS